MNDDFFETDEEEVKIFKLYTIAEKAYSDILKEGVDPMQGFGIIMGMVAKQFMKYGWKREDFVDFLKCIQETGWPDDEPKKPKLKLIKK